MTVLFVQVSGKNTIFFIMMCSKGFADCGFEETMFVSQVPSFDVGHLKPWYCSWETFADNHDAVHLANEPVDAIDIFYQTDCFFIFPPTARSDQLDVC